ncbi:unnamed protein product [Blepharisma stoltei]|uniref:TmcB/TmcC TPR repeats domain-containing protein n=1 Tax=Blepharisma stoltei TaxID=1481888 RepID=A0AAU9IUE6_9CILI|nr:unnamed protein product [Blepharisma stoltei]
MLTEFAVGEKENNDFHEFLSHSVFTNKWKEYIYGFLGQIFKEKYNHKTKWQAQLFFEILVNLILTLQLTALTWFPNMNPSGWDSFVGFWQGIAFASYDEFCVDYAVMDFCFFGTVSLIGACLASFSVFGLYIYLGKDIPAIVSILPRKIAMLLTSICIIPSTLILLLIIKYSSIDETIIEEYSDSVSSKICNYGSAGIVAAVLCLLILIFINYFSECFCCDMKHSHSKTNIKARSCAENDLNRRWYYILACILYFTFSGNYTIYYQIIGFCYTSYLYYRCIISAQYYNPIENSIQGFKMGTIASTYLIFLFGQILDDALTVVVFMIFMQPALMFITVKIVYKVYGNLKNSCEFPKNQFEFERKYRHLLTDPDLDNKNEVICLFKGFWKPGSFYKNKLFVIWEFNFCFFVMHDERLARIKLSKIAYAQSTFEGDVQEWKLFNWFIKQNNIESSETSYLDYLKEFSRIRSQDEELCFILAELQAEFSSRTPRVEKLINLVNRSANHIAHVGDGYKNLAEKHKSVEVLEIYASFLENIINNHEESNIIIRKKNGINYYNQHTDINNLESYGKELATILVSLSEHSFGTIVYLNEKAAQLLKAPIGSILGSTILNYIPQPYDSIHEKLMREFAFECNSIELHSHSKLFFQNHAGFLVECDFLIKLTAFHNSAYFLISFKLKPTVRELALISEENVIIAHTETFSYYVGSDEKCLKNKRLSDLIPILNINNMKEFEPWRIPFNGSELVFVHIKKKITSTVVHTLVVIHDYREIKNWKEGRGQDQVSQILPLKKNDKDSSENRRKSIQLLKVNFNELNFTLTAKSLDKVDADISTHQDADEQSLLKTHHEIVSNSDNNSRVSSSTRTAKYKVPNYAKSLLLQCKKKIRVLQIVLFIVMSSVIVTVLAIIGYMKTDVSYTSKLSTLSRFNQILYDINSIADAAKNLHMGVLGNASDIEILGDTEKLEKIVEDLTIMQNSMLKDFDQWSYCKCTEIITKNEVPMWHFNGNTPEIGYENLYDAVSGLILNAQKMKIAIVASQEFSSNAKFVFVNGLGNAFHYANLSVSGLVDCEIDRVKNTGTIINILLIFGFGTLGVLVLVIIGYICLVSGKHDEFWNYILNNAQWFVFKLKCEAMDRLATAHGIDQNNSSEAAIDSQKHFNLTRKVKTKLNLQYIWRIMLFFLIAASYYLLIYCYLYPICENSMLNRPKLLYNFINRRQLIVRLSIVSREIYQKYNYQEIPELYAFENHDIAQDEMVDWLKFEDKEIRKGKYLSIISSELQTRMYENIDSPTKSLREGVEVSSIDIISDIESLIYWIYTSIIDINEFLNQIDILQDEIRQEFLLADRDSIDIINKQLDTIVNVTVIYSIAVCVLFFFYYLPYFNYQIKQLKRFSVLPSILPVELE